MMRGGCDQLGVSLLMSRGWFTLGVDSWV